MLLAWFDDDDCLCGKLGKTEILEINTRHTQQAVVWFGLVWFLCLMAYQLFLGYLMPKPFS